MASIPVHMRSTLLEKLILTDVSLCDWSVDELRHPIIVGVHFIKTAVSFIPSYTTASPTVYTRFAVSTACSTHAFDVPADRRVSGSAHALNVDSRRKSIRSQRRHRTHCTKTGTSSRSCTSCNGGTQSAERMSSPGTAGGTLDCSPKTSPRKTFSHGERSLTFYTSLYGPSLTLTSDLRFYLESPLDSWAAYDAKCSHYAVSRRDLARLLAAKDQRTCASIPHAQRMLTKPHCTRDPLCKAHRVQVRASAVSCEHFPISPPAPRTRANRFLRHAQF